MNLNDLNSLYYNPKTGLSSTVNLRSAARKIGIQVTHKEARDFLIKQESNQLFKPTTVKHAFPINVTATPFSRVQIDLLDMSSESPAGNQGYKWIFCFIDTATRFAYAQPMKSKSLVECLRVFKLILSQVPDQYQIHRLDSDKEAAFRSREFVKLCQHLGIAQHFYELEDHRGTAFVERFNRTLRELIEKYKSAFNTNKWMPVLQDLLFNYNNRKHRGLGTSPQQVLDDPDLLVQSSLLTDKRYELAMKQKLNTQNLQIGDRVRLLITRKVFDKGTAPRWTKGIHTITSIDQHIYHVTDRVMGFKGFQLQKISGHPAIREPEHLDHISIPDHQAEQQSHRANRRQQRTLNREGISSVPELSRQLRERRPISLVEHAQFGRVIG